MDNRKAAELASEHACPSDMDRLIRKRRPRFESARQFGAFVRLIELEWENGSPGVPGLGPSFERIMKLGVFIDAQRRVDLERTPLPDHPRWIAQVLGAAASGEPTADDEAGREGIGRDGVRLWARADVYEYSQTEIAKAREISQTTVSRRLRGYRRVISGCLRRCRRLRT